MELEDIMALLEAEVRVSDHNVSDSDAGVSRASR